MNYRKEIHTTPELAEWYDQKYRSMGGCWKTPPSHCNRHLDDFEVPFDQSKQLLDVGCGGGHFLAEAQKRVTAVGLEISEEAIKECKTRDVRAIPGSIEDITLWAPDGDRWTFDYIVSIGSLEHIVRLDDAFANIKKMLKDDGQWYFYVPNELWKHFDQPNERTMTDEEWTKLFTDAGFTVGDSKRWNDSTAFWGMKA